jgi:hypothetical protein
MTNQRVSMRVGALALLVALCLPGVLHLLLQILVRGVLGDRESAAPLAVLMYGAGAVAAVSGPLAVVTGAGIAVWTHRPRVVAVVVLLLAVSLAGSFAAHHCYGFSPFALFGRR